jgi:uncharacterized membrane protein
LRSYRDVLQTENVIEISAPADLVYDLAANVENWPHILTHYRYVTMLQDPGAGADDGTRVEMSALRSGIPVRWGAWQALHPAERRITYHHVAGFTKGMDVEWRIEQRADGTTHVTILHALTSASAWLRSRIAEYVMGHIFVEHIADETLRGIKRQAESLAAGSTE